MSNLTPQRFGKYILLRRIAIGGMAEIFKAKVAGAVGFEKDIVIKKILPQFTDDEAFVRMFVDEARLTAKLQHPNIVQIFDFDAIEDTYYIAMEYIAGKDLRDVLDESIRQSDPLSVAQCVFIATELAKCLHYAHTKEDRGQPLNIVHRDVTPANVMISFRGDVKLMDFGIAKAAQRATKTQAGTVKGKVAYMSPEQALGRALDGRTDIFALGTVLWEMIAGRRLFMADSDFDTLSNVLKMNPPPPSRHNRACPRELDAIVAKCLAKDPEERWASGEQLAHALTRWYYANVTDPDKDKLEPLMYRLFEYEIEELEHDGELTPSGARPPRPKRPLNAETTAMRAQQRPSEEVTDTRRAPTVTRGEEATDPKAAGPAAIATQTSMTVTNGVPPARAQRWATADDDARRERRAPLWPWLIVLLLFLGGGAVAALIVSGGGDPDPGPPSGGQETPLQEATAQPEKDEPGAKEGATKAPPAGPKKEAETEAEDKARPPEPEGTAEGEPKAPAVEGTDEAEAKVPPEGTNVPNDQGDTEVEAKAPPRKETTATTELVMTVDPPSASIEASSGRVEERGKGVFAVAGLTPGTSLTVAVKAGGHKTFKREIAIGETNDPLRVDLDKVAPRPPAATRGSIMVSAHPWAQVSINGRPYGTTPTQVKNLPAGSYTVVLTKGQRTVTRRVAVAAGKQAKVFIDFNEM